MRILGKKLWRLLYNLVVKPHTFEGQNHDFERGSSFFKARGFAHLLEDLLALSIKRDA
jgi:hypothetical protein